MEQEKAGSEMGSVAAPISAFVFLYPLGIRRLWCALSRRHRVSSPSAFRCLPWYFSATTAAGDDDLHHYSSPAVYFRNPDLLAALVLLPVAAAAYASLAVVLHRPALALRTASLALFWLVLVLLPFSRRLALTDDLAFLLAALAFLSDLLALSPSPAASPIDARAADLGSAVAVGCAAACVALAARPSALAADVALAMGIALRGSWALQACVSLQLFPPRGCGVAGAEGGTWCELEEDRLRAVALLDSLFAAHATAVAAVFFGVCWAATRPPPGAAAAEAEATVTARLMMPPPELEFN